MPAIPHLLLMLVWVGFASAFFIGGKARPAGKTVVSAPRAMWGILFQAVAFAMVWARRPSAPLRADTPAPVLAIALSIGVASALCALYAKRHLGRQWRVNAALLADHDLVMSGPYSVVRHPIYAAMVGMLFMTGLIMARWEVLAAAIPIFLIGIEIRVRAEDRLLEDRFGDLFREYKRRVRAYVPYIR